MPEQLLRGAGGSLVALAGTIVYVAGLVLLIGVAAHAITWVVLRRRAAAWVWTYWSAVGSLLLAGGGALLLYGWVAFGLHSGPGSALVGLGLLLLSAGLWMLVPI